MVWLLLHIIGIILWLGVTMSLEVFAYPAARKGGDVARESWLFLNTMPAYYIEILGLALILTGGIGRIIDVGWGFFEFRWLVVKIIAAAMAILLRGYTYYLVLGKGRAALKGNVQTISAKLVPVMVAIDRSKPLGAIGFIFIVIVFWMALWKPWW